MYMYTRVDMANLLLMYSTVYLHTMYMYRNLAGRPRPRTAKIKGAARAKRTYTFNQPRPPS